MKKLFLLASASLLFWTCSTEIDVLDDWEETPVVYALLDQSQPKQYVRIQKAFLGPDNAITMAQQYDSINYLNQLTVFIQELDAQGNIWNTFTLQPDTFTKEPGFFNSAMQVVYSMNTPAGLSTSHTYKLTVSNSASGKTVDASTSLIDDFNITRPTGPSVNIVKITSSTMVEVAWNGSADARVYQVGMKFYYTETDINSVTTNKVTPEWTVGTIQTTATTATTPQQLFFEPNEFYRFLAGVIPVNPNVVSRDASYIEITVYAAGSELQTYMEINGPSSSLVQEKPFYTNINGGLGIFSSRYAKTKTNLTLTPLTQDTLACGQFSRNLRFEDRNGVVGNCQ